MKMNELKELSIDEILPMLNDYFLTLKDVPGRLEDNFKDGPFEFGYSLLKKNAKSLGIIVDGKNFFCYKSGYVVKDEQELVKYEKFVKQRVVKSSQDVVKLTCDEVDFVKRLYAESVSDVSKQDLIDKIMLVVPHMTGIKTQSGVSVYKDVWDRWRTFKEDYVMYSGTDLLTLALDEFMEKYAKEGD
ncbi:MAG: hypothetical protein IMZ40_01890 [Bacilli bacterium]|nr:hypothetical protein [Bacilli bacterium]